MSVQKKALAHFKENGNFEGFQDRTVAALEKKKHIKREGGRWIITKRGEALLAGRLGGVVESLQKLRQAIHKNPAKPGPGALSGLKKKLYDLIRKNSRAGQAWNGQELAAALKVDFSKIDHLLLDLAGAGFIHSPGADMFGSTWLAGVPSPGLFSNPSNYEESEAKAAKRSREAAERWYGEPELVNATKILRGHTFPRAFLDAGRITAIEYESDKFDGESRIYRHEVTKKRRLIISADGSTILINPPFKITKRGIEG